MEPSGTQERKRSETALQETTGETSVAAQREDPREKHHASGRGQQSRAQEHSESEENTASSSKGDAGTERRECSRSASHDTAAQRSVAAQLKKARNEHEPPSRRQPSEVQKYAESEGDSTASTQQASPNIQEEHSHVASISRADLAPRDSQGPLPMQGHRRMIGASDNQPDSASACGAASLDELKEIIEGGMVNTVCQMTTNVQHLGTKIQQLAGAVTERKRLTDQQLKEHRDFMHDLLDEMERMEAEEEQAEEEQGEEEKTEEENEHEK